MIKDYTGSELDVCSVGHELVEMGYQVEAAAYELGNPLMSQYENSGIIFTNLKEHDLLLKEYDIFIGHHNTIFMDCLVRKDFRYKKAVFSSLSPWVDIEYPPECANDLTLCMANSSETYDRMKTLGVKEDKIVIFPNYILPEFFSTIRENRQTLTRVCVVSNHVAEEIKEAVDILRNNGINVDLFGQEYQSVMITPELMVQYDVVITIGKLVLDIIQGYLAALGNLELFYQIGKERYDLHLNLQRLIEHIDSLPEIDQSIFMARS